MMLVAAVNIQQCSAVEHAEQFWIALNMFGWTVEVQLPQLWTFHSLHEHLDS